MHPGGFLIVGLNTGPKQKNPSKYLVYKHLRQKWSREIDVSPYATSTYDKSTQQTSCHSIWHGFCSSKPHAEYVPKCKKFCQDFFTKKSKDFDCKFKYDLYNVDIREKRKKEREKENEKHDCSEH